MIELAILFQDAVLAECFDSARRRVVRTEAAQGLRRSARQEECPPARAFLKRQAKPKEFEFRTDVTCLKMVGDLDTLGPFNSQREALTVGDFHDKLPTEIAPAEFEIFRANGRQRRIVPTLDDSINILGIGALGIGKLWKTLESSGQFPKTLIANPFPVGQAVINDFVNRIAAKLPR